MKKIIFSLAFFQAFTTLVLVAVASAAPKYHPAPVVHAVASYAAPDLAKPSPSSYQYAVADDYSGQVQRWHRCRDWILLRQPS